MAPQLVGSAVTTPAPARNQIAAYRPPKPNPDASPGWTAPGIPPGSWTITPVYGAPVHLRAVVGMGFGTAVVVSSGADFVVRAAGVAAARGPEWAAEPCRGIRAVHVVGAARLAAAPAPPRAAHVAVAAVFALVAAQVLVPVAALLTWVAGARTAADGARGLALSVAADPVVARLTPITSAAPTMFVVELRVSARSATLGLAVPAPLLSL